MSLSFDPGGKLIIVPTRLYGPTANILVQLALDTGATGSAVSEATARLIGYDPATASRRIRITTGSSVISAPRIPVARIEALGQIHHNFLVICHTLPPGASVDGVLGLDFFRGRRLIVDFRAGTVIVE